MATQEPKSQANTNVNRITPSIANQYFIDYFVHFQQHKIATQPWTMPDKSTVQKLMK
jgi:hypothetical protein